MTYTIDRETSYDRFARRYPLVALLISAVIFVPFMVGVVVGGCLLVVGMIAGSAAADKGGE